MNLIKSKEEEVNADLFVNIFEISLLKLYLSEVLKTLLQFLLVDAVVEKERSTRKQEVKTRCRRWEGSRRGKSE